MKNRYTFSKVSILFSILFTGLTMISKAQVSQYDFIPSSSTYSAITGGTVVATATGSSGVASLDDVIYNLPASTIPFNFTFNSAIYTGLNISTNGFITFGATAPTATDYTPISSAAAFAGAAAALGGNLNAYFFSGNAAQTGEIRYQTIGSTPNRIFIVQYRNFKTIATSGATFGPVMNFQIRLSETTNAITYAYNVTGSFASATLQVGLRGQNNTYPTNVKNRSVAVGTNTWATSINGASATATCQLASSSLPASGLTYKFAPTSCFAPTDLNVSNVTTNGAILGWTNPVVGGTFSVEYGTAGFALGTGITVSTSNTTQAISGLNPQNNYSFYVTKVCGGSNTSFTAGPFNFSTGALGEDCSTALNLNIASSLASCSYTTGTSGVSQNGPNSTCSDFTGNQAKNDIWYKFVAPSGGNKLTITTQAGTINDWVMEVWTFCPGSGSVVKCGDDQNAFMPEIQLCQNEYTAGQTYYIRTWTYNPSATGTLGICVYQSAGCVIPPVNDVCTGAIRLNVNPPNACPANQQVFTTVNATAGTEAATCDATTGKLDVWFVFNTGNFNDIKLNISPLTATNLKAQFVFECGGFQINCYNPANGTYTLTNLNPQADYIVRVWTDAAGAGTFNICLSDVCSNPTATISGSQSICTSQSASIPVTFTGVPPYTFVYSNGTSNIPVTTSNNPYNLVVTPASTTTYSLVSMSDGSCAGTVSGTHLVTVFNPQNATLNAFGAVCQNAGLQTLSGGSPAGGVYSGAGVSGTTFNPAVGTQTITYTVTYAAGCTRSASQVFTVNPLPTVTLGSFASVCNLDPSFTLTGGSPAGGIYSGPGVAGGIFSPSAAGVGTKTITYAFTNANGCSNTATSTIIVNSCGGCANPPTANAGVDKASCGSSSVSIAGSIGGGATTLVWSGGTGTYSPNTTTASINYTPSAAEITAGFAQLILTTNDPDGAGPCLAAKDTVRINITSSPTSGTITGTSALCGATNGVVYSLASQAGVNYAWTAPSNVTIVSGQGTNSITTNWPSNAVSGLITCVKSNSCGSSTANFSVTFTNPSTVTLAAFTPRCINAGNQTLSGGSPAGGVYSGTGVSGTTFNPAVGTQTITYTVTFAAGCVRSASQVFTVNPLPTVTLGAFNAVCSTDPAFTLTGGSPAGGTYSGVGVSGGVFTPSVAGVGTKTITYTFTNGNGCTNTATSTIIVNACGCANPPTANAGVDKSSCGSSSVAIAGSIGGAATTLAWSGGTGTYSPNTTTASINYTPSAAEITAGFAQLILTANDPDGAGPCVAAKDTVRINISTSPTAGSISGTAAICGATNGLTYSLTNQVGVTYTWTVPANVTIVSGQGTNSISTNWASNAASGLVSCVVSNSCGSSTANFSVTFTNPSTVTLAAFTPRCINAGNQTLSGGSPAGGVYSGTGVSGTTFNPAVGTQTITYTVTFAAGCTRSASQVFTVNPLPTVTLGAFTAVCSTDPAFTLTGGSPAGGTYSGVGVSGGQFTPSIAGVGTQTITYTFTNANGCTNTATSTIVVNACGCANPATASAGVDKSSCGTASVSITGTRGGSATSSTWSGGTGTYSPNNTSLAITYTPSAAEIAAGTVTLTLTTNDPDGAGICTAASDAMVITILNGPAVGNITGSTGVCRNQTGVVYSVANQAGVTYTWTPPAGATITAGQGTNSITTSWSGSAVSGTLSLAASNACGTSNLTYSIAVRTTAASRPGTISGSTSACRGDVYRYTIVKIANADFYVWTPPRNATINGSSLPFTTTDTAVVVTFSGTYTVDTLRVKAGNCVGQSTERTLRITQRTTVPSTPATLSGQATSICGISTVTYSFATTPSGAQSYVWRTTVAGALLNGVSGPVTITNLNNRSMTVTYPAGWVGTGSVFVRAINGCGQGAERSLSVSATPGQPSVISGPATVCTGAINQVYSVSSVFGATTYTWTIPTGITIVSGQGTPTITVNFNNTAASRTIRVTAGNACGISASRSLTVISAACPRIGDVQSTITNVQAYPNPVQDLMNVEFVSNAEEQFNLNVQDLSGRTILTQSVTSLVGTNKIEMDLSGLSSGVYLLTVQSADQLSQLKIVVE